MTVKITVFRVDEKPDECMRYVEGHRKVLEAYGVTQVTSANPNWINDPYTYIISVESTEGKILGGARIQLASGHLPLPLETAIDKLDTRVYDLVREKAPMRTAEFCGLWNSREVAGFGIGSIFLGRVGVAVSQQLELGSLFAFASEATYKNCIRVGFRVIKSIGINGMFYYPKENLIATVLVIEDLAELDGADPQERMRIFDLRSNPVQEKTEKGPRGEIEIIYDLRVNKESIMALPDNLKYNSIS